MLNMHYRHQVAMGGLPEVATADPPPIQGTATQEDTLEPSASCEESHPEDNVFVKLPIIEESELLSLEVVQGLLAQLGVFLLSLLSVLAQS